MTKNLFSYIKRWRDLEKAQKDLDFQRSQFSRDLRGEFPSGEPGDRQFIEWCDVELGLARAQADELLVRARSLEVVPDEASYNAVGGFKAVRHAIALPRKEQVAVIQAAKAQSKNVRTVLRERAAAQASVRHQASTTAPEPSPGRPRVTSNVNDDVRLLANWVAQTHGRALPKGILAIVERYATTSMRKEAA